jgi:RNA polymerase sigma-70 factor (ECF subfamily)
MTFSGDGFAALLAAAAGGDEGAFALLWREYNPRLLRYLGHHAPQEADDLAADAWLAASRRLSAFAGDERGFRAWLFTIARHELVDHWRSTGRRPSTPLPPASMPDRQNGTDLEGDVMAIEDATAAVKAITAALSPDQADVILLRVLGDLTVEEVAALLGRRPGTVRVLQHRALKILAKREIAQSVTL